MAKMFQVNGYWKDEHDDQFSGYLVSEFNDCPKGFHESEIFYYGLSEEDIKRSVALDDDNLEFVITDYKVLKNGDN